MSIAAAQKFIAKAKETIKGYDDATGEFYKKFVRGDEKPTSEDVKELAKIIAEMDKVAAFYHDDLRSAIMMFGGPSDTKISTAKVLLDTVKKKAK